MKISTYRHSFLVLAIGLGLTGCSGDNFLSRGLRNTPPETLEPKGGYGPSVVDGRQLIAQVTSLRVESSHGGAIIRATGLADRQGYWNAGLVLAPADSGATSEMRLEFRVHPPATPAPGGPERSREITAAVFATNQELNGIRSITVVGAQNAQTTRR